MSTFMKGDTAIEVYSCLARTDVKDAQSFASAIEVVKTYVRSKIKKGKGKEVAGPGGKLEALESKYAHLGYQDIFYMTRLSLALPPSAIHLPRPTSPCQRLLLKAKYPLPAEYQIITPVSTHSTSTVNTLPIGLVTPRSMVVDEDAISVMASDGGNESRATSRGRSGGVNEPVELRRGRGMTIKDIAWDSRQSLNSTSTVNLAGEHGESSRHPQHTTSPISPKPPILTLRTVSSTLSLPPHALSESMSPSSADLGQGRAGPSNPTTSIPIPRSRERDEREERDLFDHTPSARPGGEMMRANSTRSGMSDSSVQSQANAQVGQAGGYETEVRRLLEARIKALQSALNHLDTDMSQPIPLPLPQALPPTPPLQHFPPSSPSLPQPTIDTTTSPSLQPQRNPLSPKNQTPARLLRSSSGSSTGSSIVLNRSNSPAPSPPPSIPLPPIPLSQTSTSTFGPGSSAPRPRLLPTSSSSNPPRVLSPTSTPSNYVYRPPSSSSVSSSSGPNAALDGRLRIHSPTLARQPSYETRTTPLTPLHRATPSSPGGNISEGSSPSLPTSPTMVFDLDPEHSLDPFAGPPLGAGSSGRLMSTVTPVGQVLRSVSDMGGRGKVVAGRAVGVEEGRWTPPPEYEA